VSPTALIVGAGIGGLAAGVALERAGWTVRVFEKAENPRELGFALNLATNAVAALRELGVADQVVSGGYAARIAELRAGGGRVLRRIDGRGIMSDSIVAMRPVVHGALLAVLGDESLELAHEAVRFDDTGDSVVLHLRDGRSISGDILVGADGIASVVRSQLHPHEPAPQSSGYCAVRGVVHDIDGILRELDGVLYFADGVEAAVVRASAHGAYWYLSLLASDVKAAPGDSRRLAMHAASALDDTFRRVVDATSDVDLRFDELFYRRPLPQWGSGRVTLLGDAAHPMLPHTGQGAAQAMEDAVALGLAFRKYPEGREALRHYEQVRRARTTRVVQAGPRIARTTTSRRTAVRVLRNAVVRYAPMSLIVMALQNTSQRDPHAALR
jgi:2-polyprenyl-6-methoxyphenol hydroxylase-like FAD-dependent oxidoreductase